MSGHYPYHRTRVKEIQKKINEIDKHQTKLNKELDELKSKARKEFLKSSNAYSEFVDRVRTLTAELKTLEANPAADPTAVQAKQVELEIAKCSFGFIKEASFAIQPPEPKTPV